ncbi:zinc ribbon domain-containing protein [Methanoregula sp. UBA64]|uniref:zinc ribbon domain-containing protein n=1 Tax=Methanoregula sp. UBA64 TaxID=1915554 RepID=UPI0025D372C3|nr:zinc ribbon domain-containing protein [Methanoregula sp. UBA64]
MAKKCGNCGAPAPDTNSKFCDLCGAPLADEEQSNPQGLPVCPVCGAVVSDKIAQFCDVCGAPLAKPICPVCRNIAPSYHSKFCSRCGAAFVPAAPPRTRTVPAAGYEPEPEPVKVKTRKEPLPVAEPSADEWDPWTDGDPTYDVSAPLPPQNQQKTDLQRMSEGMTPAVRRPAAANQLDMVQMAEPRKKYSHLPLIADELQADLNRRAADMPLPREDNGQPAQSKQGKKKGLFHK